MPRYCRNGKSAREIGSSHGNAVGLLPNEVTHSDLRQIQDLHEFSPENERLDAPKIEVDASDDFPFSIGVNFLGEPAMKILQGVYWLVWNEHIYFCFVSTLR